jgi:hypothetical protein
MACRPPGFKCLPVNPRRPLRPPGVRYADLAQGGTVTVVGIDHLMASASKDRWTASPSRKIDDKGKAPHEFYAADRRHRRFCGWRGKRNHCHDPRLARHVSAVGRALGQRECYQISVWRFPYDRIASDAAVNSRRHPLPTNQRTPSQPEGYARGRATQSLPRFRCRSFLISV